MQIGQLLRSAGLSPNVLSFQNCTQGRNNRTYLIQTVDGPFVIKQYLRQESDIRDRLGSEFAFLSYAKEVAPQRVPKPFYQDLKHGMALYEFLEGQPLQPQEVTASEVDQAAEFFCSLNAPEKRIQALNSPLPKASEACFSIQEHLDLISARIQQLESVVPETLEDQAAALLIQDLRSYWNSLVKEVVRIAKADQQDLTEPLDNKQRCISPSDFGFHNALRQPNGTIYFLDFEYAGWDDPAKMTGDFFSQLALPIPAELFNDFVKKVMQPFPDSEQLMRRAWLLRLVYRVKWCCIALNIFLPVHLARYRFANSSLNVAEFKRKQVAKVTKLLESLEKHDYVLY